MYSPSDASRGIRPAAILVAVCILAGCETLGDGPTPGARDVASIVYSQHIQRIFDTRCVDCHGRAAPARGLRLDSWEAVFLGSNHGEAVIPFASDESLLIEMLTKKADTVHPVDVGEARLTEDEIALLRRWIDEGAVDDDATVPFATTNDLVYAVNGGEASVSVIEPRSQQVVRYVDFVRMGFEPDAEPYHVAVEPDGSFWYVSMSGADEVLKMSRDNVIIGRAPVDSPGLLAVDPVRDRVYVGRALGASNSPTTMLILRRTDMAVSEIDVSFPLPHAMAVRPQGDAVFTSSFQVDQFMSVDPVTEHVRITALSGPDLGLMQFAVHPAGARMWGTGATNSGLTLFDISRPDDVVQRQSIPIGGTPWQPAFLPDGSRMYVSEPAGDRVVVVSHAGSVVIDEITGSGIAGPSGVVVSPGGGFVFVSNSNSSGNYVPRYDLGDNHEDGTVVVIDTSTNKVVRVLEVGRRPGALNTRRIVATF